MRKDVKELLRPVFHTHVGRRVRREYQAAESIIRGVEAFDRPAWLYRARGAVPRVDLRCRPPQPVTQAELALCQRLIDAYWLAQDEAPKPPGMWSHRIFQDRHRELTDALVKRDPAILAQRLGSMFRSDVVLGMAPGSVGLATCSRLGARFWCLFTLSKLVALAESQSATRTESLEQGAVGIAFADGVDPLIERLEAALGISLDFPDVGAPYGIELAGRLITRDTPDHVYAAARIRCAMRTYISMQDQAVRIVEIGGGYGAMAYWLMCMTGVQYVIVDLPLVNVLQGYFLSHALGDPEVSLYGEEAARVTIVPTHALSSVELPFDALVNKDSMPEIPEPTLLEYLSWAQGGCKSFFYSVNQEAAAPYDGTPQNVVSQMVARTGGFQAAHRDAYWLRRGYIEEIYRCDMAKSGADRSRQAAHLGMGSNYAPT